MRGVVVMTILMFAAPAWAELRIVSMNASNVGSATSGPRPGMDSILSAIGSAESDDPTMPGTSGITRPIDVLLLQEARNNATTAASYAALLNSIHSTGVYSAGTLDGGTTGSGTQVIVYNSTTVRLMESTAVGVSSTTGQPRQSLRYRLRPVGLISPAADVFVYNVHFKAGGTGTDEARRLVEAEAIRSDADLLPANSNILVAGDLNVPNSTDDSYARLLSPGLGAVVDPISKPGNWSDGTTFLAIHTQSPYRQSLNPDFGGSTGGMDDRFDQQLVSRTVMSGGAGLQYAVNSYNAFGNNGSHAVNQPIDSGSGAAASVLTALASILDHLPIVADFQLRPRQGLAYPGDATLDEKTDISDFAIVAANFNVADTGWRRGDFDDSGATNIGDFSILAANFNTMASRRVPEPLTFGTLIAVALARRWRPRIQEM